MSDERPDVPDGDPPRRGGLGRSAAVMAAGTATSRVLGVVRASVLVGAVGFTSATANAFAAANWLPNVIYMLIAGGVINAVLVPQVVRAYRSRDGQEYVDRLLTVSGVLLLGVTAVVTLAAPLVVRLSVDGEDPAFIGLATLFALWCLPQVFFYGTYTLLGQVLNARGVFGPYMWAPVVNNVVAIAGLGVFIALYGRFEEGGPADSFDFWTAGPVAVLAGTATLGVVLQAVVLLVPLRRIGFRFRPRRGWRGVGLGTAGRVAGWTFAALVIGQLGVLVVTRMSSAAAQRSDYAAEVAGNAAYNYAFTIFMLPHSLVTVSLVTALFTRLSNHAAADDTAGVRRDFSGGLRTIGVFTVFATAALAVLALPVSRLILVAGAPESAAALAPVVVTLAAGLVALGAWALVQRVYYAYEDARGLFWVQVPMALVVAGGTYLGTLVLPIEWWTAGAGASIAASYVLGAVRGGLAVRHRLGGGGGAVLRMHVRAALAAVVAVGVGWPLTVLFGDLSDASFLEAAVVCAVVGLVMLGVYVGGLRVLRVEELDALAAWVARAARPLGRLLGPLGTRWAAVRRSMSGPGPDRRAPAGRHGGDRLDGVVVGRGTLLAGRYRLEHPATTDLADVEAWSARDQILDRPVRALVLRAERSRQAQDGARRAALVSDPRLLRVLDVGDHEGLPYVVTEPVAGRDLAELTAHGPIPADQARSIVGEAAVALEVARRRGVHHLALRPSTVHVTEEGGVVVSGLGLDGELSGRGAGDARTTTRRDTVDLVALLYLALTGRWPAPDGVDPGHVPTAPHVEGAPVPPAELSPAVPNDLDTLCAVTLGPHDDGPHSPAELVRELEPWNPVAAAELFGALDAAAQWRDAVGAPATPADDSRTDPAGPTTTEDGDMPDETTEQAPAAPRTVQRTSVRDATGPLPVAPVGTPPPAIPPSTHRSRPFTGPTAAPTPPVPGEDRTDTAERAPVDPEVRTDAAGTDGPGPDARRDGERPAPAPRTGAAAATAGATPTAAARTAAPSVTARVPDHAPGREAAPHGPHHPPVVPPTPAEDFDELIGEAAPSLVTRRFNPTPWVLLLVLAALAFGVVQAFGALSRPAPPIGGSDGYGDVVDVVSPPPTEEAPADEETPAEEQPAEEQPAPSAPPVIASSQQIDPPPDGDQNEHPEAVQLAHDGDPSTFWFSRTYASPTYGMKSGIGYAVTLAEPTTVTTVTLLTNNTGGRVEVRLTDPATPTEGEVLASGPLSPQTVLTLAQPTEGQHVVLWFPELPQIADGRNRIELTEIQVS